MRTHLSAHVCNDDPALWSFVRNSRLPLGTFPRAHRNRLARLTWIASGVLAIVLLVAAWT